MGTLHVEQGDITRFTVDAIVNAANERMLGGGGVDGAIHRAAGPDLLAACRRVREVTPGVRCPTGQARITPGFRLAAKHVIHTVGPVFQGGSAGEDALLTSAYRASLELAHQHDIATIAFPAVSCGVFGYPPERAARVAVAAVRAHLAGETTLERVILVALDSAVFAALEAAVADE